MSVPDCRMSNGIIKIGWHQMPGHFAALKNLIRFTSYFFKNALNRSIGNGRNVVVLCSLAISRMVWR